MEVTLREYRPGDLNAMYRLDVECFDPVFRFSRATMRRFAEAKEAVTVVAEAEGNTLAGFAIAEIAEEAAYVVTIDVAVAWRRRGLGRLLMSEVEDRTEAAGGKTLSLHVYAANASAVRLYEQLGYKHTGTAKNFYGTGMDGLMYQKELTSWVAGER